MMKVRQHFLLLVYDNFSENATKIFGSFGKH